MILLGFRRKLTALTLCKSIESAIQWFQIHHRITFATIWNPAVYLSGARVSFFSTLVPRLSSACKFWHYHEGRSKILQVHFYLTSRAQTVEKSHHVSITIDHIYINCWFAIYRHCLRMCDTKGSTCLLWDITTEKSGLCCYVVRITQNTYVKK